MRSKKEIALVTASATAETLKEWTEAEMVLATLNGEHVADTAKDRAKAKRCAMIQQLRSDPEQMLTKKQIIVRMQSLPDYASLSTAQLYRDLKDTEFVYGRLFPLNKEYERAFLLEYSRHTMSVARKSKNVDSMVKAQDSHRRLADLDKDEIDMIDWKTLAANSKVELHVDQVTINQILVLTSKGNVDFG